MLLTNLSFAMTDCVEKKMVSHQLAEKLAALRESTKRLGELLDEYYALRAKYDKRPRK